ncbi:MAG: ABC transporter permease [Ignisphaera sp.]
MSLKRYLIKRGITYIVVFVVAITIVWALVRFAPGDPGLTAVMRSFMAPGVRYTEEQIEEFKQRARAMLGLDLPLHEQYILFWARLFQGDLGWSMYYSAPVAPKLVEVLTYDLILITPAVIVSWFLGNWIGALAARHRKLDRVFIPIIYVLTSIPYFLLGLAFAYILGVVYPVFKPTIMRTDIDPFLSSPSIETFSMFMKAYTLPFLSMVLVSLGGWASGMRTLMIYELESNYARFMESLGFSERKVAGYAFRYAINPQITGLGIQIGTIIVAGIVVSSVFNYPGAGIALIYAINFRDIFLIQGITIFYTLMVIVANFIIDILYAVIDPRIRLGVVGA